MTPTLLIFVLCFATTQGRRKHVHEFEIPQAQTKQKNSTKIWSGLNLKGFSWKDCGTSSSLVHIQSLSLSPDPLAFPGPVNVAAEFVVKQSLVTPLKGQLKVYKKIFGTYIEIPCVDNVGSCTYDDLCSKLAPIQGKCPDSLKKIGIDCSCPIAANSYNLGKTEFDVSASVIPGGDYHIIADITMNGAQATCIDMYISVA